MSDFTDTLVKIATKEVGVRERPANSNMGERVNTYKATTWLPANKPWPWCAAFICWVILKAMEALKIKETRTFKRPKTAGAWDFINWSKAQDNTTSTILRPKNKDIKSGDIVVFTISHIGLATSTCDSEGFFEAVEGNTDIKGSREGGGVYAKRRHISKIKARIRFTI